MPLTRAAAEQVAAAVDLHLDELAICEACLSFVTFALDRADLREIARATARLTPILWEEGLALPARLALERARSEGVPNAGAAVEELALDGGRSGVARAIVLRLAGQQRARDLLC
jgi:hypothetical protein